MHAPPKPRKEPRALPPQTLKGLKVLDLTWHVAGPYATRLLADGGADVVKVERPRLGDPARTFGPFPNNDPHPERSGLFLALNAGKRSVTLDLRTGEGRAIILELASWADVAVESFAPGTLEALGLGYEALKEANPVLVLCSLSNFGQRGPRRDWKATEFTLAAAAGLLNPDRARPAPHYLEYCAGAQAAAAIAQAVAGTNGGLLDTAIVDAAHTGNVDVPLLARVYSVDATSPRLAQHNREVYMGMLGFCAAELVFLRQTGAI